MRDRVFGAERNDGPRGHRSGRGFRAGDQRICERECSTTASAGTTRSWPRPGRRAFRRDAFAEGALPELIEAAVRCRDAELARRALERLTAQTRRERHRVGARPRGPIARAASDGDTAESLYREAIERLERTRALVDLARAHLLYGEWLRRERHRLDARQQLRTALEMFRAMGTEAFAARAEHELLATGERVRKRTVETREDLTAQEAQIARLARDGLSNAEIGARLIISQHTVAYHLRKVFTKLDINSRNQLDGVLPDRAGAARWRSARRGRLAPTRRSDCSTLRLPEGPSGRPWPPTRR